MKTRKEIKLNSNRNPDVEGLEASLRYHFRDKKLLIEALTHPSAVKEGKSEGPDNQRLEFLGDAVIQLVVSHMLMVKFPGRDEGSLSFMRADVVRKENLAELAHGIDLLEHVVIGSSLDSAEAVAFESVAADALEAVLGAVFLDGGWQAARDVTGRIFIRLPEPDENLKGCKSALQESIQGRFNGEVPIYIVEENLQGGSEERFRARVYHGNRLLGSGSGRSKKKAEESAACEAVEKMAGKGR